MTLALLLLSCAGSRTPVSPALSQSPQGLDSELAIHGSAAERTVTTPASLVVLYSAEEGGSLVPCGCDKKPMGGLARTGAYVQALRAANPELPILALNAGGWLDPGRALDGGARPEAIVRNRWMGQGLAGLGFVGLNLAASDMAGLPPDQVDQLPLLSSSVAHPQLAGSRILEAGDYRVGVVGIAAPGPAWMAPAGWTVPDADQAAAAIAAMRPQVDLVVLLAHDASEAARLLALDGGIDLVIEADDYREQWPPFRVGEALWVRAHGQGTRLGELRLVIEQGRITKALDRTVLLDDAIEEEPAMRALVRQAEAEAVDIERATYGRPLR